MRCLRFAPCVLLLLASCTTRSLPLGSEVHGPDRQLTIRATNDLLGRLSRGECGAIYAEGSSHFHSRLLPHWLEECEAFRRLGPWMGFTAKLVVNCGTKCLCAFGTSSSVHPILVSWTWENGQHRLSSFSAGEGTEVRAFPPVPLPPPLADPPRLPRKFGPSNS